MRLLLVVLALMLAAAAPPRPPCPQPADHQCMIGEPASIRLGSGQIATAERIIRVARDSLPLERPLAVRIAALASAEVSWNGRVIGRNGIVAADAGAEVPGRYFATFTVPSSLVRPGDNVVSVRLSANRLWLPVRRPVHFLDVGPYETPELPGRSAYLPALLAFGAIAAAFVYFAAAAAWSRTRGATLAAAFALTALLQLAAEVSRAFHSFTYPWALGRVTGIAVLSAAAATIMAAYAARRFMVRRRRALVSATGAAAACALVLVPWFDFKALSAILAGALGLAGAGATRMRRGLAGARWALAASAAIVIAMLWEATAFLDMAWFLIVAALLILLVIEQIGHFRSARAEAARAAALAERLARAERRGEPILSLKDGSRTRRVAESDVVAIRAADDYCDALLADGRALLVTMTLSKLLATLPERFVRVHKSWAVNRAHVSAAEPRPGGGRILKMSDGREVPVGRSYAAAALEALS